MTNFNEELNRFKLKALLESVRIDMLNYLKDSGITDSEATQLVDDFTKAKDKGMIKLNNDRNLQLWMKKPALDFKKFVNELKNIKSNTELRVLTKNEGAELLFEDNYWYVYHIKNYGACKIYGSGTKWCITQKSNWEEYTASEESTSIFYFIISKVLPDTDLYYKIAARVKSDGIEYYISNDDEVSRNDIISHLNLSDITFPKESILKYIRPICKKYGVTSTPDGEFIIPKGVIKIGKDMFKDAQLIKVIIPDSVTSIGDYAFVGNELTEIDIPGSVTSIGEFAFAHNKLLTSINLSNGLKEIGYGSFYDNGLTIVKIPDSVTEIGDYAFSYNNLTNVTISNGVTIIGDYAFDGNQLPKIKIPDSVTKIGKKAFRGNKISSVYIPDSVTEIGENAFDPNVKIIRGKSESRPRSKNESFNSSDGGDFSIEDGVLLKYNGTSKDVVIPDGITEIGKKAFGFNQIISVKIPDSVTKISDFAFRGNNLSRVVIPSSITEIGDYAFDKNVEIIRGKNKSEQYLYK